MGEHSNDEYQLAQLNIGRLAAPLDSQQLKGFVDGLAPVNALAESATGFVWRLEDEETGDATSFRPFDDEWIIVNMSVWATHGALWDFVYDDEHRSYLRRRREWFERMDEAMTVLWWVPAGHRPTLTEARECLEHLRKHGLSEYAFGLRDAFPPPPAGTDYAPRG